MINYYLFKYTCIISSERWPVIPISLLHRLSYAIYSQLSAVLHIDLECDEQNRMKMSQQSHSIYITSSSGTVLTENIFQKLSVIVTQKNYSGHAGTLLWHSALLDWQSHSVLSCSYYCDVIRIIHLSLHLFLWRFGRGTRWTDSEMDGIENTENSMSCLVPVYEFQYA